MSLPGASKSASYKATDAMGRTAETMQGADTNIVIRCK